MYLINQENEKIAPCYTMVGVIEKHKTEGARMLLYLYCYRYKIIYIIENTSINLSYLFTNPLR